MADLASSQIEVGRSASRHFRRLKSCKHSVHPLRGSKLVAAPHLGARLGAHDELWRRPPPTH
jgi:hypothetical protein